MIEEAGAPGCQYYQAANVSQNPVDRALHAVNLHLYDLDHLLQEVQLVLGRAVQRLLVQLNRHSDDGLLQMAAVGLEKPFVLDVGEMAECSWNVLLNVHLHSLYPPLVNRALLQVVRS